MKVLFLVPYPTGSAASQRFRFEQYYEILNKIGFSIKVYSFFDYKSWLFLYKKGHLFIKVNAILIGCLRRILLLLSIRQYDFVFIHRETAPIGPPIIEWIIAKCFNKRIVYDFDDAIWIPNASNTNRFMFYLKSFQNTSKTSKLAYKVSCGNEYLRQFALNYNSNAYLIPTVVDTNNYHNHIKSHDNKDFVVGWTGTHSTIIYLEKIIPLLEELEKEFSFSFIVISDSNPDFQLKSFQYMKWKKETEIEDLLKINVGLMPLTPDKWAEGKCGFKAIQYMALGIPALVSPIGVNKNIVDNNVNGYICNTEEDWKSNIRFLYENRTMLQAMANKCRIKIEQKYSVNANKENFLRLFS